MEQRFEGETLEGNSPYHRCQRFLLEGLQPGQTVLDLGCGDGRLLSSLAALGCHVRGVEIAPDLVETCKGQGFDVVQGSAEQLPFEDATFDAVVCSVVLPYTDERWAIAEIARVLKPGGLANLTCHGLGYARELLGRRGNWRVRLYGVRMLANTYIYGWTGRRLPLFLGDTICQRPSSLRRHFTHCGLVIEQEEPIAWVGRHPRFLAERVRKPGA